MPQPPNSQGIPGQPSWPPVETVFRQASGPTGSFASREASQVAKPSLWLNQLETWDTVELVDVFQTRAQTMRHVLAPFLRAWKNLLRTTFEEYALLLVIEGAAQRIRLGKVLVCLPRLLLRAPPEPKPPEDGKHQAPLDCLSLANARRTALTQARFQRMLHSHLDAAAPCRRLFKEEHDRHSGSQ